ncbi:uncharacterized protein LOC113649776 isoform X1 [Tachysurus ichikawai]
MEQAQESAEEEVDRSSGGDGGNETELESYNRAKFTLWASIICWTALRLLIQVSTVLYTTELTLTDPEAEDGCSRATDGERISVPHTGIPHVQRFIPPDLPRTSPQINTVAELSEGDLVWLLQQILSQSNLRKRIKEEEVVVDKRTFPKL